MRDEETIKEAWSNLWVKDKVEWQTCLNVYNERTNTSRNQWGVVEEVMVERGHFGPLKTNSEMAAEEYEQAIAAQELMDGS